MAIQNPVNQTISGMLPKPLNLANQGINAILNAKPVAQPQLTPLQSPAQPIVAPNNPVMPQDDTFGTGSGAAIKAMKAAAAARNAQPMAPATPPSGQMTNPNGIPTSPAQPPAVPVQGQTGQNGTTTLGVNQSGSPQYTRDVQGNPIDPNNPNAQAGAAVNSQIQQGAQMFQGSIFNTPGSTQMPGSALEQERLLQEQQQAQRAAQVNMNNQAQQIAAQQNQQFNIQQQSGQAGNQMQMAQGQEQVQSASHPEQVQQYNAFSNQSIDIANKQMQYAQAQRAEALRQLDVAQANQQFDKIGQLQGQVEYWDQKLISRNIEAGTLQNQINQTANQRQQIQNTAVNSFQSALESGATFTPQAIQAAAQQMGVNPGDLQGYSDAAQRIREDKSLSTQDKQIALEVAGQKFKDLQQGKVSEAAYNASYIDNLRRQGVSQEILDKMQTAMGLPTTPAVEAKIQSDQAQANYYNNGATPNQAADALLKRGEYNAKYGTTDASIPSVQGKYQVIQQGTGVHVSVKGDGSEEGGQCGEFTANITGTHTGDTYAEKMSHVTKNADGTNVLAKPGDIGIERVASGKFAENGHTVYLESINPDGMTGTIVQSNGVDQGGVWRENKITRVTNYPLSKVDGWVEPDGSVPLGKQATTGLPAQNYQSSEVQDFNSHARDPKYFPFSMSGTYENISKQTAWIQKYNQFEAVSKSPDLPLDAVAFYSMGRDNPDQSTLDMLAATPITLNNLNDLSQSIVSLRGKNPDVFTPLVTMVKGAVSNTGVIPDDKIRAIEATLTSILPGATKGMIGGRVTNFDLGYSANQFPKLTDTASTTKFITDLAKKIMVNKFENSFRDAASVSNMSNQLGILNRMKPYIDDVNAAKSNTGSSWAQRASGAATSKVSLPSIDEATQIYNSHEKDNTWNSL